MKKMISTLLLAALLALAALLPACSSKNKEKEGLPASPGGDTVSVDDKGTVEKAVTSGQVEVTTSSGKPFDQYTDEEAESALQSLADAAQSRIDSGELKYDPDNLPQFGHFPEEEQNTK